MDITGDFREAAADDRHGATQIELKLIQRLLQRQAEWRREVFELGAAELLRGQPAMANLRRLAGEVLDEDDAESLERRLRRRERVLLELADRLSEHGAALVESCDRVVTISRSTAVASVIHGAAAHGWRGRVVVLDGTFSGRGVEQARELRDAGVDVQSLPDGAMFEAFDEPASRMLILVGADAVSPDRFVNAQGTHVLLEIGAALGVRRVLIADTGKNVCETDIDAVLEVSRLHEEPGPDRRWPVFEAVPLELIDLQITESSC